VHRQVNRRLKLYAVGDEAWMKVRIRAVNKPFIPNYGDRYRHGEAISTAFAESTVNQVVSRRMVK
jgi:hypothetical protein